MLKPINTLTLQPYDTDAINLYNAELRKAHLQMLFEIIILVLLCLAIELTRHHICYFIAACVVIKIYFSWNACDLLKKGKLVYLKVEEWNNLS